MVQISIQNFPDAVLTSPLQTKQIKKNCHRLFQISLNT